MNRQGLSGQPIRGGMPGFPSQQTQLGRTARGSGNASGWGFGMQNGSGQGLSHPGRGLGNASTFAQSVGGGQSSAPLDPTEFPSLTGSAQSQFQNSGQAVWSSQRPGQQGQVQRGQQLQATPLGSSQQRSGHTAQEHAQQSIDEAFFSSRNTTGVALDDFRHGGSGGIGQLSMGGHPQSGGDEFPPLGRRLEGDLGQDRRMNIMQNAAGGLSNFSSEAGGQSQDRNGRSQQNGNESSLFRDPLATSQQSIIGREGNTTGNSTIDSPNSSGQGRKSPSQMADRDRYGLGGLLEQIRNGDSDSSNLAIGMDLTNLGLELNSSEPLYPTFAGPFANGPTRPLQPDYVLPVCYSVTNIHPIEEKIGSLSDETLFFIFYTMPRDVMQEQAAVELTHRNWRYHKALQLWMTKEHAFGEPQPIAQDVERGRYMIFNQHAWQRESREMILRYADLDEHVTNAMPGAVP